MPQNLNTIRTTMVNISRRILSSLAFGTATLIVGGFCLIHGNMPLANALAIYPSSSVFYVIPESISSQWREAMLFWFGVMSVIVFWAAVFNVALLFGMWLCSKRRASPRRKYVNISRAARSR
jgi:hypothetical protein